MLQNKPPVLHATVMGVSVTAGCGVSGIGSRLCWPHLSWARRIVDLYKQYATSLQHMLHLPAVEWSVWPKNAAPIQFWLQCTQMNFGISNTTNLVLIETEATLDVNDEKEVMQLVRQLRHAAAHAVIAFVMWPSQAQFSSRRASERMIQTIARHKLFWSH